MSNLRRKHKCLIFSLFVVMFTKKSFDTLLKSKTIVKCCKVF